MNIRNRKAISPLITTLLLIAIAVAASVLTYSWVMSMVGSQSAQAQTQVRIDTVTWLKTGADPPTTPQTYVPTKNFDLLIRNTGSVAAQVESISIRTNTAGSTASVWKAPAGASIDVGVTSTLNFTGLTSVPVFGPWALSTSYIIRVTTTTGFYYEMVATTPSS
jgi:flagellin-like protein